MENRLVAIVGTWSSPTAYYSYDPANKRVWRGNWAYSGSWARTEDEITFWSVNGQKLATYNVTQYGATLYATQSGTNYYFGAKLIKNASGWVYSNRLGSIGTFFPYGQERPSATTNNTEKFTGYFRDAETGNDYAVNRYESAGTGRFLTPDQGGRPKPSHPSSWNKYAYAEGDPANGVDPTGQFAVAPGQPGAPTCSFEGIPLSPGECGGTFGWDWPCSVGVAIYCSPAPAPVLMPLRNPRVPTLSCPSEQGASGATYYCLYDSGPNWTAFTTAVSTLDNLIAQDPDCSSWLSGGPAGNGALENLLENVSGTIVLANNIIGPPGYSGGTS